MNFSGRTEKHYEKPQAGLMTSLAGTDPDTCRIRV